jgi:hypothetical protein
MKTLAEALFPAEDQNGTKHLAKQEQLDSIGIDSRSAAHLPQFSLYLREVNSNDRYII